MFVMEKCDDGWFVGTSAATGCFGTFPGNYVQKICKCLTRYGMLWCDGLVDVVHQYTSVVWLMWYTSVVWLMYTSVVWLM